MKKMLVACGLSVLHNCFAGCISVGTSYNPTGIVQNIYIKNDTQDDLTTKGDCGVNTIHKNEKGGPYSHLSCWNQELSQINCTVTDSSGSSTTLTANYSNNVYCSDATQVKLSASPSLQLKTFYCPYIDLSGPTLLTNVTCSTPENINTSIYTQSMYFDITNNTPTYTLEWNNIFTTLVKGQAMANTLANNLKKAIDYDNVKNASYNATQKKITIVLSDSDSTSDPYAAENPPNCKAVNT